MRVIKPPPPPKEYVTSCDTCHAGLAFTKNDCQASGDDRDPGVVLECPCCASKIYRSQEVFK